jgi:hypothetical protein
MLKDMDGCVKSKVTASTKVLERKGCNHTSAIAHSNWQSMSFSLTCSTQDTCTRTGTGDATSNWNRGLCTNG